MDTESREVIVDARGLPPPEPLNLVLGALESLEARQRVRFLVDREPVPLYRVLRDDGFVHSATLLDDGSYAILISRRGE
ncbi:MAG: DUF2249 domain-containing protein [Thiotrichales bacterium]